LFEPKLHLFDARADDVDEQGLRQLARAHSPGAAHASRSYRFPYAVIARHDHQVGVDIERIERQDRAFAESICTPSERERLDGIDDLGRFASSLWCSKEALSKALGDPLAYDPRRLESPMWWPSGESGPWRARELELVPDHVVWLCWRE
jgi:phosphopantetheinyl transferase